MRCADRRDAARGRAWRRLAWGGLILLLGAGCAPVSVDTIRLTRDRFPPKPSVEQVDWLSRKSPRPSREVAELSARGESVSFDRLQRAILKEAAALGADAVVFGAGDTHIKEGVTYQPMYSPWGYNDPYYGPDPGYYGPYMAVPYSVDVRSLKATAVVYTDVPSGVR